MKTGWRNIVNGREFNSYFPKTEGDFIMVKKGATLDDTMSLIKRVIEETLDDTKKIAHHLQGAGVLPTCKKIWNFCFWHFQYKKDEERKEQVRRPARSWADRGDNIRLDVGVDCDCFTVLIGSILTNLGIPFIMRMTRYKAADFEHIYPVAISPDGQEIIIDCVVHQFNYEVPYTQKKDEQMDLQYLNGIEGERDNDFGEKVKFIHELPIDAEDLFRDEIEFYGLGDAAKRAERREKKAERKANPGQVKAKVKAALKKGINAVNKLNPATALLRAGILASMKLNLFKVASNLRFAYWTKAEAEKNQMDMEKFDQLQQIRVKLEKIYYTAGGNANALKESILKGKGNQDKLVQLNGLGAIIPEVRDEDDLQKILGDDIFYQELAGFDGLHGLGNLGSAIAAGAAVTAASGVLASISALVKKLGGLFKKGSIGEQKMQIKANTDNAAEATRKFSVKNIVSKVKSKIQQRRENKALKKSESPGSTDTGEQIIVTEEDPAYEDNLEIIPEDEYTGGDDTANADETGSGDSPVQNRDAAADGGEKKGLGQWISDNKVTASLIGLGLAAGAFFGIRALVKSKKGKSKGAKNGVDGLPKGKSKNKSKSATKQKPAKNKSKKYTAKRIELL
ncbi:MAG: hypothetical protein HYZ14_03095 [Bacteroidetes bacterium]|nr:hypothetical protein [Bacteroidota bacterium]